MPPRARADRDGHRHAGMVLRVHCTAYGPYSLLQVRRREDISLESKGLPLNGRGTHGAQLRQRRRPLALDCAATAAHLDSHHARDERRRLASR